MKITVELTPFELDRVVHLLEKLHWQDIRNRAAHDDEDAYTIQAAMVKLRSQLNE